MSGLVARRICPLALMKSDDQNPYQICELQAHVSQQVVFGLRWRACRSSRFNALAKLQTVICATAPWICLQEGRRPYAFANISARKISPVLIIAQMIRASLLASATVTRRAGFFARSALIHSASAPLRLLTLRSSEVAERTSSFLMWRFPLLMPPSVCLPPLEFCRGVSPSQAAKSRPDLNTLGSGVDAVITEAISLPTPGTLASKRLTSLRAWASAICPSRSPIAFS